MKTLCQVSEVTAPVGLGREQKTRRGNGHVCSKQVCDLQTGGRRPAACYFSLVEANTRLRLHYT